MRRMVLFLVLLTAGCSGGIYKVPASEYRQQVKTLGVLPLMVDSRSVILQQVSYGIAVRMAVMSMALGSQSDFYEAEA